MTLLGKPRITRDLVPSEWCAYVWVADEWPAAINWPRLMDAYSESPADAYDVLMAMCGRPA